MSFLQVAVGSIVALSFLFGYIIYYFSKEEIDKFRNKLITSSAPGAAMFLGLFVMPMLEHYPGLVLVLLAVGMVFGLFVANLKQNIRNSIICAVSFSLVYVYFSFFA